MNLPLLLGLWIAIFLAYLTVVIMRWHLGRREDDYLHVSEAEQPLVSVQASIGHKLDVLDRWKTALLILTIVSALIIGGLHVYNFWMESSSTPRFS
jgi:hypothetical protein